MHTLRVEGEVTQKRGGLLGAEAGDRGGPHAYAETAQHFNGNDLSHARNRQLIRRCHSLIGPNAELFLPRFKKESERYLGAGLTPREMGWDAYQVFITKLTLAFAMTAIRRPSIGLASPAARKVMCPFVSPSPRRVLLAPSSTVTPRGSGFA